MQPLLSLLWSSWLLGEGISWLRGITAVVVLLSVWGALRFRAA